MRYCLVLMARGQTWEGEMAFPVGKLSLPKSSEDIVSKRESSLTRTAGLQHCCGLATQSHSGLLCIFKITKWLGKKQILRNPCTHPRNLKLPLVKVNSGRRESLRRNIVLEDLGSAQLSLGASHQQ